MVVLWTALRCVLDAEQALTLGFYCCLHALNEYRCRARMMAPMLQ